MGRLWTRWAALLALTVMLAACGAAVSQEPAATPGPPAEPAQVTCDDSAIRLLDRGAGIHGAIVADTLHLGGATAPATCTDPTNESLAARLADAGGRTAQVQQSEYYLIVIRYTSGNRLYVISLRGDGTACVVDTDDECVAEVTGLPDDFDLGDLPDDMARTIPAGRPAPPDVSPSPGGDDTPPAASPPPAPSGPAGAASNPQPPDGATGVPVDAPLLSWSAAPGALSYDVHWHIHEPGQTAGINTTSTFFRMSARTSTKATYGETARLQGETTYYWRVDALRGGTLGCLTDGSCTFGQTWSFTTGPMPSTPPPAATGPPRTATNSYPRPGQTGVRGVHRDTTIDTPIAWWTEVPRALSYDVHWSKDVRAIRADNPRAFASTTSIGTSSTSRGMGPLDPETTYYWRVDPKNGAGVTKGNVWWFTTGTLVPPPEEETLPEEEQSPAPAWPAAATDYKIEGVVARHVTDRPYFSVPPPTGNPKPVISIAGSLPAALGYHRHLDDLQRLRFYASSLGAKGTITLVASNSEGRAELEVPYNLTCPYTIAEIIEKLRGSWVVNNTNYGARGSGFQVKYTSMTIGDTITTVPASSGPLDQDYAAEYARRKRTGGGYILGLDEERVSGHTACHQIFHADYSLTNAYHVDGYGYDAPEFTGCGRRIRLVPTEEPPPDGGNVTVFKPAGCESGHSDEEQPPPRP